MIHHILLKMKKNISFNILGLGIGLTSFISLHAQNVGIGIQSPQSRLEIQGTTSGTSNSSLHVLNSNANSLLFVRDDGNIGISNATPAERLDLIGRVRLRNSNGGFVNLGAGVGLGSVSYDLPTTDGNPGDVLTTNGFGSLSWTAGGGSSGGGGGGGTTVSCNTSFNTNYTIRGTGSGQYECTDAVWITSTGKVGIGSTSPNSSFDLTVGTNGFVVNGSTTTSNILGRLRIGSSLSSSYDLQVDGSAYIDDLRVGTTSTPPTNGIITTALRISSSTTGTGTAVVRTSGGDIRPQSSTRKVKDNIRPLHVDAKKVMALRPVIYNLKPALGGGQEVGLVAEEVEQAVPELVIYGPARTWIGDSGLTEMNADGSEKLDLTRQEPYTVAYDRLPVYLLEVIRSQQQTIEALERRIEALERKP